MQKFFYPQSVAVVGVSPRRGNLSRNIVANLDTFGYQGEVLLVGPKGGELRGRPIYPTPEDLPTTPELAVILTPAATVPGLVESLGQKGVRRVVIESGGFSELSAQRGDLEKQLRESAERHQMRFIGPNCIGLMNIDNGLTVPFPLLDHKTPAGPLSIISQSGGVGLTYYHALNLSKVGVAKFISVGNKLNVDESELLEYMLADPLTEIVLLYLESINNGRRLVELIRASDKPVLVHKSNIGQTSHAIAQSHTTALANDDRVVDAALRQAGALRGSTVSECLQIAKGLMLPKPKGNRLVVVSRSGGHAVVAADAAHRYGMNLPPLPQGLLDEAQEHTRAAVIKLQNPLDLGDMFDFPLYVAIVRQALAQDSVDAVVLVHGYRGQEVEANRKMIVEVGKICHQMNKPVALSLFVDPKELAEVTRISSLPLFPYPEEAICALAAAAQVGQKAPLAEASCARDLDQQRVGRILTAAGPDGELELPEALHLISAAGVPVAPFVAALDPEDAAQAAATLGFPVVLKAVGPGLSHKSEQGGVVLGLAEAAAVRAAAQKMTDSLKPSRLLVMSQIDGGREVIVGAKSDPSFGPLVLVGSGGVAAEVLQDVQLRLAPVSSSEAGQMIDELAGAALLSGFRGSQAVHRPSLVQNIVRVAELASCFPQIAELDINPLLVGPGGAMAVDARARVAADD